MLVGPKRRVAVVDFENKTIYGKRRLGSSVADILVTELKKSDRFILVEREKINKILEEQKFQYTGAVAESTVVELGKILGVSAMITGSVSQFGVKTESGSAIISESKTQTAQAVVDVRVVDIATGKLLYAESAKELLKNIIFFLV